MHIETLICPAMHEGSIFSIVGRYAFAINHLIRSKKEHSDKRSATNTLIARIAVDYGC